MDIKLGRLIKLSRARTLANRTAQGQPLPPIFRTVIVDHCAAASLPTKGFRLFRRCRHD